MTLDPIKDKKALNDPMIANKKIKAKKEQPNRPQENPKKIKETQENLIKSSVPSKQQAKQTTNCLSRGYRVYDTTDPDIYSDTTDLIIGACIIV